MIYAANMHMDKNRHKKHLARTPTHTFPFTFAHTCAVLGTTLTLAPTAVTSAPSVAPTAAPTIVTTSAPSAAPLECGVPSVPATQEDIDNIIASG